MHDEAAARAAPEFTVLAALVPGREGVSSGVVRAALAKAALAKAALAKAVLAKAVLAKAVLAKAVLEVARRDESRGTLVLDALLDGLGPVARQMWEGTMRFENDEFEREAFPESLATSLAEGVARGRDEGRELGLEQAREEGRDEGARAALRGAVRALADGLGLGWPGAREAVVAALDAPRLQALVESVARHRRWPD